VTVHDAIAFVGVDETVVLRRAADHGFTLEDDDSAASHWWTWRRQSQGHPRSHPRSFRTRREAMFWIYDWLLTNGHYA